MSRIGKKAITIPKDVKVEFNEGLISVTGPRGNLQRRLHAAVTLELKEGLIFVKKIGSDKLAGSLFGLHRALIFNMIKGVTEGFLKQLEVIGMGFRAQLDKNNLVLLLGFSHPVNVPIPEGIKIEVPKQTQIIITGIDKEKVGQVAASIRAIFPPEPYKGKGIRYANEFVKKKVGKTVTK